MNRIVLSFLVSFILLLFVIALNRITYNNGRKYTREAEHSRNVIKLLDQLAIQMRSAEIYSPTYTNSPAKDLYAIYKADMESIGRTLSALKDSISENKEQVIIVDSIQQLVQKQLLILREKNIPEIIAANESWRFADLKEIHQLIEKGLRVEETLLQIRKEEIIESSGWNNTLTLIISIFAILIITITFFGQLFLSKRRKWLEGFLESILDTSLNGIVYYKAVRENGVITDFKVEFANKAISSLLGVEPENIIGKKLTQLDSYTRKTELFAIYTKAVEKGDPIKLEHLFLNNNLEKWLYVSISKMDDGITVAFQDISELKRYEADLKKNITALELSNKELEEYAYAASHDLQEPLRKIRTFGGFLQDAQQNHLDEKGKQQLTKILQAAERMSLLIKDLLSFSSLKQKEEFVHADLNEILENVLEDLEVLIIQKGAIITHDPLPEIEAIPVQINQLFYNLVNNSLKFARSDLPLHLDIGCKLLTPEEIKVIPGLKSGVLYYEIVFSDNGIGFNHDYANQIFGLFKRLNDKNVYAGSGIGLALCKKVVTNHGGVIDATGKENLGAQFYIYLPQNQKH